MENNSINDVIDRHAPRLIQLDGVLGVYSGEGKEHLPVIVILVSSNAEAVVGKLPLMLEGFEVLIETSGNISAMGEKQSPGSLDSSEITV